MTGQDWSRTGVVVAGAMLALVGITAPGHSQSAGSIGVRVQVVKAWDPVEAVVGQGGQDGHGGQGGQGVVMALRSSQPTADRPVLVEVEVPREARPGRVTVVVP